MKRLTVVAVICLTLFSTSLFSNENTLSNEEFFYKHKQINYEKLASTLENNIKNAPEYLAKDPMYQNISVTISLKEWMIDPRFTGKGGDEIKQQYPTEYSRLLKDLIGVMADLPNASYLNFEFVSYMMSIETSLTKEGLDYLYSRDDVFITELIRVRPL